MTRIYKRLFILPHYLLGIAWLMMTAGVAYPYFWWIGFEREKLFSFFQFQGDVVYGLLRPVVRGVSVVRKDTDDAGAARLYAANHQSVMDAFVFSQLGVRRVVHVAKNWPFRIPFYGRYLRAAGFVNTEEAGLDELCEKIRALLADGVSVVFFPEGTRGKTLGRFHSLAFHVAVTVSVGVTPVVISGHAAMLPPRCHWPRPAKLRYTILPTLSVEDFKDAAGPLRMARTVRHIIAAELGAENLAISRKTDLIFKR
ncbi:MAG: 1-acyl-sn-glycerol-3-phosphate acyltransferase [Verrucomicrobiales bacterium]|jgi:1-acyl-sn-glycerol-3-phosphate acyltransferase|nr:1-acyl-sn-glycerol-3-phosphate acyltransferase [Verrucomicrobiales bacterium]